MATLAGGSHLREAALPARRGAWLYAAGMKTGGNDMASTATRMAIGFAAGALAVLVVHQGMFAILHATGMVPNPPWRTNPVPPYGVPTIVNQAFWGGLWGVAYALAYDRLPGAGWLKGFLFGMIGPMLLGSWLVVAAIKGQPLMAGLVPQRLLIGFLLNGVAFGIGLGIIYPLLRGMAGSGRT
jgi:hypothetical protein